MNTKWFNVISIVLIIVLAVVLAIILIDYFNDSSDVTPIYDDNDYIEVDSNLPGEIASGEEEIILSSGETQGIIPNQSVSGEITKVIDVVPQNPIGDKPSGVIISSESTMTNREKKEILSELDKTLMELLEVVDKVQVVDETRLITEEGEVQK